MITPPRDKRFFMLSKRRKKREDQLYAIQRLAKELRERKPKTRPKK